MIRHLPLALLTVLLCVSQSHGFRRYCYCPCVPEVKWERIRACDVVASDPVVAQAQSSDVFCGTVKSITRHRTNLLVAFQVQHVWKGDIGETVTIVTPTSYAMRGYTFHKGQAYLVYCQRALQSEAIRVTSTLSRTQPLDVAQRDIEALNKEAAADE